MEDKSRNLLEGRYVRQDVFEALWAGRSVVGGIPGAYPARGEGALVGGGGLYK